MRTRHHRDLSSHHHHSSSHHHYAEARVLRPEVAARGRKLIETVRPQDLHVPETLRVQSTRLPQTLREQGSRLREMRAPELHLPERVGELHLTERLADMPRPHLEFRRPQKKRKRQWYEEAWPYLLAGLAGAILMYVLDPAQGRRRRALARDKSGAAARRAGRTLTRSARGTAAGTRALAAKATHPRFMQHEPDDDVTLERKVESEVFRNRGVPKGDININVQHGTVVLRGQVERPDQIADIERRVRRVVGVHQVENLMHLPGQPAPNKAEALEAQQQAERIIASGQGGDRPQF